MKFRNGITESHHLERIIAVNYKSMKRFLLLSILIFAGIGLLSVWDDFYKQAESVYTVNSLSDFGTSAGFGYWA